MGWSLQILSSLEEKTMWILNEYVITKFNKGIEPIKSIYENNKSYIDFSFKNQENNLEIKYER